MKSQNDSSRAPTDLGRFFGHPFPNTGHWLAILFHRRPNGAGGSDTSAAEQKTYVTRTLRLYWSIPSGSNGMFFQFRHKTVHVHEKHTERRNMGKWTSYFEESLCLSSLPPVDTGVEPVPRRSSAGSQTSHRAVSKRVLRSSIVSWAFSAPERV